MFKKSTLAIALGLLVSSVSYADPVDITIHGRIVASPCELDTAGSNLDVDLGDIQGSSLLASGDTAGDKSFVLKLINCPESTTSATLKLSGSADSTFTDYFTATGDPNTADKLDVGVLYSGVAKGNNATIVQNIEADHSTTYNLVAQVKAKDVVDPGNFSSTVTADFTYN